MYEEQLIHTKKPAKPSASGTALIRARVGANQQVKSRRESRKAVPPRTARRLKRGCLVRVRVRVRIRVRVQVRVRVWVRVRRLRQAQVGADEGDGAEAAEGSEAG
eukprot:scaffold33105_cov63-Phaeocystis_antarctica.AAC.1